MSDRFSYVKYTPESVAKQEAFKSMFEAIESYGMKNLIDGRARSLFLTALEEAYMWTGKAIRDEQMAPTGYSPSVMGMPEVPQGLCKNPNQHRPERG